MGPYKIVSLNSLLVLMLLLQSCGSEPEITDQMLDSEVLFDASLYNPQDFLVSYSNPNPDASQMIEPVFIVTHGFSATTFEWEEFRDYITLQTSAQVSMVLLGGHGRSYSDFKESTWKDWQEPIITEYDRLLAAGYTNIQFVASSASCSLLIQLISSGYFNNLTPPSHIYLIDPFVIPSDKTLSIVGVVGPMLGYVEAVNTTEEDLYWYHFRPYETLKELNQLIREVRNELEDGIQLPSGTQFKVYKSIRDDVADPAGVVLIYKGIQTSNNGKVDVELIDSDLHVFTRLGLRSNVSSADQQKQLETFEDIVLRSGN